MAIQEGDAAIERGDVITFNTTEEMDMFFEAL